jgi:iron complex transport system substrate-binding protein
MLRLRQTPMVVAVVALAAALLSAGCGDSDGTASTAEAESVFPLTIDNCGEQVTLDQRPEAIFTSGTTPVNLLVGVGAADAIVGRSGEFGQELVEGVGEAVDDVPVVTPDRPTAEVVIGSGADLMFSDPPNLEGLRPQLEAAGVRVLSTCNHDTFEEVWSSVELLGRMMGTEDRASTLVAGLEERLGEVAASRLGGDSSAAVVSVFQNTLYADGNATLKHSMLEVLGLRNVFADQDQETFEVNVETLIDADPEVIVLAYGSDGETFQDARQILSGTPGAGQITAVRSNAIVGIPFTLSFGSPQAVDGLEGLAEGLEETMP